MRPLLILAALLLPLPSQAAVEITHFKSGLACTKTTLTQGGDGWICQPTQDVLVTDQGVCVFNGENNPCTWTGFEFDYTGAKKGEKLQCVSRTSAPVNSGNPVELIAEDVTSQSYELELDGGSGHVFNPQYYVFALHPKSEAALIEDGHCTSDGKVVFEYRFHVRFPSRD